MKTISATVPVSIELSEDRIDAILREEIAKAVEARIDQRIGLLSLEEVMPRLRCKTVRMVFDCCGRWGIPIIKLGAKKKFVRIADVEAALKRRELRIADKPSIRGTTIQALNAA